jgi:hypothetical protein
MPVTDNQFVKFPFGKADLIAPAAAAAISVKIKNTKTIVKLTGLTEATTLNIAADSILEVGAELHVDVVQGATGRNVTFGTRLLATTLTGVNNNRDVVSFVYDGTTFIGVSNLKIVA